MPNSTFNADCQTTVPAEVLKRLKATLGTTLAWSVFSDGRVFVRAKTGRLADLAGSVKAPECVHATVEQMGP